MTMDVNALLSPATAQEWLGTLLSNAQVLGLTTTSWQSGAPERTILAILSYALQFADTTASLIAQGGYLDFAATGTVTYTNIDGTTTTVPVTPDPSKPAENPTGALGWLDVLVDSVYDEQRIRATYAGGAGAVVNTSVTTYGPFAVGTYHTANSFNRATYSNTTTLTIAPSAIAGTTISGVVASSGLISITTSTNHGLTSGDVVAIVGVLGVTPLLTPTAWYVDVTGVTTLTLRGSNFAGTYTSGGKVYLPTVATFQADTIGSPSNSVNAQGVADVHTVTQTVTTLVGVSTDNLVVFTGSDVESNVALAARARLKLQSLSRNGPGGAYRFAALSSQKLAPTLNPPLVVSQVINRVAVFTDRLTGSVLVWLANASGPPSSQDVTATDAVIQAYSVPDAVTAIVAGATASSVTAAADVWIPSTLITDATQALFETALQSYFATLAIGGETDPATVPAYSHVVPFDAVLGAIFAAGEAARIPIHQATLTLNGGTADIPLTFTTAEADVAVLSPVVPSITLHAAS